MLQDSTSDFYVPGLDQVCEQFAEWKSGQNEDAITWKAEEEISHLEIQIKVSARDVQSV